MLRAHLRAVLVVSVVLWLGTKPAWAAPGPCAGDCNGDGVVAINEIILGINALLSGSPPPPECQLDTNGDDAVGVAELVTAIGHLLTACPLPTGALGTRHFSLDPETSLLVSVISNTPFPQVGFTGFLELTAGEPDPITGIALVDVTDASEFISVDIPLPGAPSICVRPVRDLFPIENAGAVFCNGGVPVGFSLSQDHNIGVVDTCTAPVAKGAGMRLEEGMPCDADEECASGQCFTEADCLAATSGDPFEIPSRVEGPDDSHPGVCNGPTVAAPLPEDSGLGAVFIGTDPVTGLTQGLPVEILTELALPCGDEPDAPGAGAIVPLTLTTATAAGQVVDFNNEEGEILAGEQMGENFSCINWAQEDGPGTLVFSGPLLDQSVVGSVQDLISLFCLGRLTSLAVYREAV